MELDSDTIDLTGSVQEEETLDTGMTRILRDRSSISDAIIQTVQLLKQLLIRDVKALFRREFILKALAYGILPYVGAFCVVVLIVLWNDYGGFIVCGALGAIWLYFMVQIAMRPKGNA